MISQIKFDSSEILNTLNTKNCCGYAFLSAILKINANYSETNGDIVIYLKLNNSKVFGLLKKTIDNFYDGLTVAKTNDEVKITGKKIGDLLVDAGVFNKENYSLNFGIDSSILEEDCCKITFIKTLYLTCGKLYCNTSNNTKSTGYHLEFVFKDYATMDDVLSLFKSLGLNFKKHQRFNSQTIYTKNSDTICDFFSLIGAVEQVLNIENSLTVRELRNNLNRANNCFDSNLNKTINASFLQIEAIEYIVDKIGIDYLDDEEKEIALLRLANPEAPLSVLMQLYGKNISRSGIKYKLDKIVKIYKSKKE